MLTKVKTTSKKAFSILLAFVMCFTAFAVCMPVIADAIAVNTYVYGRYYYYPAGTQFISSIRYGQAEKSADANSGATQDGHTRLDTDFNSGVSGKDYIYLGYKTSTNINDAIATYFRNGHSVSSDTTTFNVNGKTLSFTVTGLNTSGKKDLNADAGGDYIYLYATKDPQAGLPVTAIAASSSGDPGSQAPGGYYTVERDNSGTISDCNADAGGDYVYIYFNNTSAYTDVTNQMLRLKAALETAAKLGNQNCYTASTWLTYSTALNEANRIIGLYNNVYQAGTASASEITNAASALENAMNGLQGVVRFDAATNGGTTTATDYSTLVRDSATMLVPAGSYTASKAGHTFLGWNTDKNATTGNKGNMTVPVGSTLYAIFSINSYNVNFMNTLTNQSVKTESVKHGSDATAPEVSQIVRNNADTHYEFKGWDKEYSNITAGLTVNTIYEAVNHTYELTSETASTCKKTGSKVYTCSVCGQTKTETLPLNPENHVNTVSYPAKESTCNVAGYTAYTFCNDCQTIISGRETLPLAEHTWGDWSASTATCIQDGISTRKCTVCSSTDTKNVAATGHSWGDWETTREATCTVDGREQRKCSACNETETRFIDAPGHSYDDVVTDPTCIDIGYTTHTCSVCGDSYIDSYVDALGHDWEDVGAPTVEATCTTNGKQHQECTRCDATQEATVEALGHDWKNETITKEATCTENGSMAATCDRCGESQNAIVIPALGHAWDDGVVTVQPTCTTAGNLHMTCETCGEERDITMNALDHAWDDGVIMIQPSCTAEGEKYHICVRDDCGEIKIEKIAKLPHEYKGVVKFPTCTEGGYTTYTCGVCGDVLVDDIVDALGHSNIVTVVPPSCAMQGYTVTRCLVCDEIERTDYVPATGHNYKESAVLPTCTEQGYTLVQCSICGDSSKKDFVDPLGHEYADSIVDPTCTEKGYELHTCIRGDYSYMDNYVDALGHKHVEDSRVEPTKTQSGYILYVCEVCDNEKKEILYYDGKALVYITLYDTEGNPVPNATVSFTEMNTGEKFVLKTDLNGYFTEVLPEGDYELFITGIGFKDTYGYIYVNSGKATIDIPELPVIDKDDCDCYCHQTDFFSAIRRIFAKILKIFGVKHDCCAHSDV